MTKDKLQDAVDTLMANMRQPPNVINGIAAGIITPDGGIETYCNGYADVALGTSVATDTIFQIGSVSKVFTTTALARAVQDGTFSLSDTVQGCYDRLGVSQVTVPYGISVVTPDALASTPPDGPAQVPMTLQDLATYTSGLPEESPPPNPEAYGDFSAQDMHAYLTCLSQNGPLKAAPGEAYFYVNTNFGVLGELLYLAANQTDYSAVIADVISGAELNMPDTGVITSDSPDLPNLATGYTANGEVSPHYLLPTSPAIDGAGAIYSTIDDMMQWLSFNMGLTDSPWNDLLPSLQAELFDMGKGRFAGLGWFEGPLGNSGYAHWSKNGGTSGFRSFIGFVPDQGIGVMVVANANVQTGAGPDKTESPIDFMAESLLYDLLP